MGVGDPLEAAYTLSGPIAAGSWHLVGDGLVLQPVDMTFDVILRPKGGADQAIATFTHHFDPPTGTKAYDAVALDADAQGAAAPAKDGDQLVLRFSAQSQAAGAVFIPNADGSHTQGRIPSLTLP